MNTADENKDNRKENLKDLIKQYQQSSTID